MVMMTQSTGLDNVRRRSDLPSRDSLIVPRRCLRRDGVWREGRAVADSIAVSEYSVLPLLLHNKLVTSPQLTSLTVKLTRGLQYPYSEQQGAKAGHP